MRGFFQSLRQYAVFDGRSSPAQYWSFMVYAIVLTVLLVAADAALGTMSYEIGLGWLSGVFVVAITLPMLAVTSRRMHDAGWPGWLALLHLVPVVGSVVVSLAALKGGQPGRNAWGDPPASKVTWRTFCANALALVLLTGGAVATIGIFSMKQMTAALDRDGPRYQAAGASFGAHQTPSS